MAGTTVPEAVSTTGTSSSSSESAGGACLDRCVAAAPEGWAGPFYPADAGDSPNCPTGYEVSDVAFSGLGYQSAECACSCDAERSTCAVDVAIGAQGCVTPGIAVSLSDGGCETFDALGFSVSVVATMSGAPASCSPSLTMALNEPTWVHTTLLCAAPARPGDCGSGSCTALPPTGFPSRICIARDGQQECPVGPYAQREVLVRDFVDGRSCEGCSCTGSESCEGDVFASDGSDCEAAEQVLPLDECVVLDVSGGYSIGAVINDQPCSATTPFPVGVVSPADSLTLCCDE